jgi:hypothetical protein
MRSVTAVCALLVVLGPAVSGTTEGKNAPHRRARSAGSSSGWEALLLPPKGKGKTVPENWKLVKEPRGFQTVGYDGKGEVAGTPKALERLTRDSVIIVAGIGAGNDGGFYPARPERNPLERQFTTYYLKVFGYLKDETGRRSPFLRVLAPGGFLDGGKLGGDNVPLPYLETGRRYLLYLTPNYGIPWGSRGPTGIPVGKSDDMWVSGYGLGYWYENEAGKMQSPIFSSENWRESLMGLSFGQAVRQAIAISNRQKESSRILDRRPTKKPKRTPAANR